jgi:hypothetical protein
LTIPPSASGACPSTLDIIFCTATNSTSIAHPTANIPCTAVKRPSKEGDKERKLSLFKSRIILEH